MERAGSPVDFPSPFMNQRSGWLVGGFWRVIMEVGKRPWPKLIWPSPMRGPFRMAALSRLVWRIAQWLAMSPNHRVRHRHMRVVTVLAGGDNLIVTYHLIPAS